MVSQLYLMCGSTLCLGARPRYNLVVDEDVKKANKQTNPSPLVLLPFLSSSSLSLQLAPIPPSILLLCIWNTDPHSDPSLTLWFSMESEIGIKVYPHEKALEEGKGLVLILEDYPPIIPCILPCPFTTFFCPAFVLTFFPV